VSTWGIGDLQQDWDTRINLLAPVDFSGKKVAFFGLGDAMGYPDSFLDAKEPDLEIFDIPAGSSKRACRCSGICRICLCAEKEPRSNE
jgi:flavodoxin